MRDNHCLQKNIEDDIVINRRQFCLNSLLAGAASAFAFAPARAKNLDAVSAPGFVLPANATDCHVHIFDPIRFPYASTRRYTPPPATVSDLMDFHRALGMQRVVLVQPSVYGTDNSCMLNALSRIGARARGVAVIGQKFSRSQLVDMAGAGVRGVRINMEVGRERDASDALSKFLATQEQIAQTGMFIQVYGALPVLAAIAPELMKAQVPVLIDHFGLAQASAGVHQDGFDALLELLRARRAFIKLSGPYQISKGVPAYRDIHPVARALAQAAPGQAVWGSDWPHTGGANRPANYKPADFELFRTEDDGHNLGLLREWAPTAASRAEILVSTPEKLFGF